ncbi:MAG: DUF4158 domain-containing protein, partial [Planctomycetaceae bacterium]|nr:DUF4158 domain-containing protein [Planctomycetaceae bacterium]
MALSPKRSVYGRVHVFLQRSQNLSIKYVPKSELSIYFWIDFRDKPFMPTDMYTPYLPYTPFSTEDVARIMTCRGEHNRLGFAYQLAFVRSLNRFPAQTPLEIEEDILIFSSAQLRIDLQDDWPYGNRQKTVSEHQEAIRNYLSLRPFNTAVAEIEAFLFKEAYQLEQIAALNTRLKTFLRT